MSFTGIVKSEISKRLPLETEAISELSAIVRNIGKYDGNHIAITTENEDVARHIVSKPATRTVATLEPTIGLCSKNNMLPIKENNNIYNKQKNEQNMRIELRKPQPTKYIISDQNEWFSKCCCITIKRKQR